jgi:hypothetical protein
MGHHGGEELAWHLPDGVPTQPSPLLTGPHPGLPDERYGYLHLPGDTNV